jgi:hypothetical protein
MTTMNQVPVTILEQLGGRKFLAMTGAKSLVGGEDDLRFRLPVVSTPKGRVDAFWVKLEADDTYTLEALKWDAKALEMKRVNRAEGVYCDNLQAFFTSMTGLYTHL